MMDHERDLMARALTAYCERVTHYCERYVTQRGITLEDVIYGPYWESIVNSEAGLLGEEKPAGYLARTIADIDALFDDVTEKTSGRPLTNEVGPE